MSNSTLWGKCTNGVCTGNNSVHNSAILTCCIGKEEGGEREGRREEEKKKDMTFRNNSNSKGTQFEPLCASPALQNFSH